MKSNERHLAEPDILRGVAILLVVSYHIFGPAVGWNVPWGSLWRNFAMAENPAIVWFYPFTFGWVGVSLFFVLSGFCIHLSFLRSASFSTGKFFWQRFWRICPSYFVAVLAFFIMTGLSVRTSEGMTQLLSHILLVHNFFDSGFFGINPSFWSIATEVQLYLLFPLLLWIRKRRGIVFCLMVTGVVALCFRATALWFRGLPEHAIDLAFCSPLVTWFDWTLGAHVAEAYHKRERAFKRPLPWFVAGSALFCLSTVFRPLLPFSFSLGALASAVLLDSVLRRQWLQRPSLRWALLPLSFVGVISYSVYLWHQPLIFRFWWKLGVIHDPWLRTGLTILCLLALSILSYVVLERGSMKAGKILWSKLASLEPRLSEAHREPVPPVKEPTTAPLA